MSERCPKCGARRIEAKGTPKGLVSYACGSYKNPKLNGFLESEKCMARQLPLLRTRLEQVERENAELRKQIPDDSYVPEGAVRVNAWLYGKSYVIEADPVDVPEGDEEYGHNCDVMGCGSLSHVIRVPIDYEQQWYQLQAQLAAMRGVVEAATALFTSLVEFGSEETGKHCGEASQRLHGTLLKLAALKGGGGDE